MNDIQPIDGERIETTAVEGARKEPTGHPLDEIVRTMDRYRVGMAGASRILQERDAHAAPAPEAITPDPTGEGCAWQPTTAAPGSDAENPPKGYRLVVEGEARSVFARPGTLHWGMGKWHPADLSMGCPGGYVRSFYGPFAIPLAPPQESAAPAAQERQETDRERAVRLDDPAKAKREARLAELTDENDYPDMDAMSWNGEWPGVLDLLATVKDERDTAERQRDEAVAARNRYHDERNAAMTGVEELSNKLATAEQERDEARADLATAREALNEQMREHQLTEEMGGAVSRAYQERDEALERVRGLEAWKVEVTDAANRLLEHLRDFTRPAGPERELRGSLLDAINSSAALSANAEGDA